MKRTVVLSVIALVLGAALGLGYSWVVAPVRYVDTSPDTLRADFKDAYRAAIAAAYGSTGNLDRARARLALLGDANPVDALTAQAQRMLASGEAFQVVRQIAGLASDLRSGVVSVSGSPAGPTAAASAAASQPAASALPVALATRSPAPSPTATLVPTLEPSPTQPEPTSPPPNTPTPRPSATPIPTASRPFQLITQDPVCNPNLTSGLMQVSVLDSHRHQMPGVEIDISWEGGEESFFTGLKPEIGAGYADFVMQPGVSYALRVARAGQPIAGLAAPSCPDSSGGSYLGGLKLVFQQP